jgi:hypothetical protein
MDELATCMVFAKAEIENTTDTDMQTIKTAGNVITFFIEIPPKVVEFLIR